MQNTNQKLLWIAAGVSFIAAFMFIVIEKSLFGWIFIIAGLGLLALSTRAGLDWLATTPLAPFGRAGRYLISLYIVIFAPTLCCWAGFAIIGEG